MNKFKFLKSFGGLVLGAIITAMSTKLTVSEEVDKKLRDVEVTINKKEREP